MRNLLSPFLLISVSGLSAQAPIIGAAQFFQEGPVYIRDNYDPPPNFISELVQSAGPGYSVDLSPVNSMFLYATDELTRTPASGPYLFYPDYYDTANVRLYVHQEQTDFGTFLFLSNADGVQYVGGQPNGVTWSMESAFMRYPDAHLTLELSEGMTYGYVHQGTMNGQWLDASGSDDHYVEGSYTVEADGYGSIQMPDGTVITNTLRLRTTVAYTDSNALFGITDHSDTIYTWYAQGISGPLLTLSVGFQPMTGGYISFFPLAVYHPVALTGIPVITSHTPIVRIPSIADDGRLQVRVDHQMKEATLDLFDPAGRRVNEWPLIAPVSELDVSDLPAGLYHALYSDTRNRIDLPVLIVR